MGHIFLRIYLFFEQRKSVFWIFFFSLIVLLGVGASRIKLEEDITKFFPNDQRVDKLNYIFKNAKFVERIVLMVSVKDSAHSPMPDSLVAVADRLKNSIAGNLNDYVKSISTGVDEEKILEIFQYVQNYLPVFLEEKDYTRLDSLTTPSIARTVLAENYRQLISPAGVATKNIIVKDPLGFSFIVLKKLQQLQYDENFELYDNYIMTKDHRHVLLFIQPANPPGATAENSKFVEALDQLLEEKLRGNLTIEASYFGAPVVAAGNAKQLQRDTILTVGLMLFLLLVVLLGYFRKKRIPFLIIIPVVFGALFSLCCISLIQGAVSILALAVGAVILGIAVDYALHYLVHLKQYADAGLVIKEISSAMIIGSATTVIAFFCLQFANASVLRDIGLFAGFSLIGAALCSLIILPHLIHQRSLTNHEENIVDKISRFSFEGNKYLVWGIFILTPLFLYFSSHVKFNNDMSKLNFMSEETHAAQQRLEFINKASLNSIYVVSADSTFESALRKNERATASVNKLRIAGLINKFSSVSTFLISDSLQQKRIYKWNSFWTGERKDLIRKVLHEEAARLKLSPQIINNFDTLISKKYHPLTDDITQTIRNAFFNDHIIEKDNLVTIITLAQVPAANKTTVYNELRASSVQASDRQMLTNLFVEYVNDDFNLIVTFTSVIVFFSLLIVYGRIELTLITFVPMLFTWIWILGIMALAGIEFNIVNVMVSTFIFGLGDDYSIFIMDGLKQEYRAKKLTLPSIRVSIFLSAVTTIVGLGVLIFAQHPALKSIAAISIIGIVCVFIMSQTIEPFLFREMITNRTAKGFNPLTLRTLAWTIFTYVYFVLGSLGLTLVGLLLKLIPVKRKKIRLFYHSLISGFTRALVYSGVHVDKHIINETPQTFERASVIISNHSSFMDILVTIMLHPKLILLTNKWVWDSPIFGGVVRLADYYPVTSGAEDSIERLADRVKEGYSIVVFPEGTRSADKTIKRFHKGAFYIAEVLKIPIQPLVIHGAGDVIMKGDIVVNNGSITLQFLPPITPDNTSFGVTYSERTKIVSRYFRNAYRELAETCETTDYFRYKLISNYIYKGPVLEWYARIKTRLEKNYNQFNSLVPRDASVLDLGCGYGFLCYMLSFVSAARKITGVDYDEEKIETANGCFSKTDALKFIHADILKFPLATYDVIIIADVLHYLLPEEQDALLIKCFAALNSGGKLIVRDGNADLVNRHEGTKLTEFFSVKLLKFNKSTHELNFLSGDKIKRLCIQHGLTLEVLDETKLTSNVIFVMQKAASPNFAIV